MNYPTTTKAANSISETLRLELASRTDGIGNNLSTQFGNVSQAFKKNISNTFSGLTKVAGFFAVELSKTVTPNMSVFQDDTGSNNLQVFSLRSNNNEQKTEISKELYSYMLLEPGWDGPDSVQPSTSAIADASEFIWRLPIDANLPEPTVYADGQVGWYWHNNDDVLSVVFSGDRKYAYYGAVKGDIARSPTRQFSGAIPVELFAAIRNI